MLDTSFWTVSFKVGLIGYLFRIFEVMPPGTVERELSEPDRQYPNRLYPDAALFREMRHQMVDPHTAEPEPLRMFGSGEAAAIARAQMLSAALLINDQRPAAFARNLGLTVVTVPDFIVLIRARELIPDHVGRPCW